VSLFDEITMTLGGRGVFVRSDHPDVPPGPQNTIFRAARLVLDTAGDEGGVDIHIEKKIPIQSGLGGASSNAAAVMKKLNQVMRLGFTSEELLRLGMQVGSDVPFFLYGSPALVTGRGEVLEKIEGIPEAWLVIVKPRGGISTREAYKSVDLLLTEDKKNIMIPRFNGTLEDLVVAMSNDFEPIAEREIGQISEIKDRLVRLGSMKAMLTGSGSAVFGLFPDEISAHRACSALRDRPEWSVFVAKNLFD
jgi:4-diphosphocytidyl-2-C-methyl-D-erythritol kinase